MILESNSSFEIEKKYISDSVDETVEELKEQYLNSALLEIVYGSVLHMIKDKDRLPESFKVNLKLEFLDFK